MLKDENLEKYIKKVEDLLNEIKNEQIEIGKNIDYYHKVNMKSFSKLKEFNEICDMTNQMFEIRISNIEKALIEVVKYIK